MRRIILNKWINRLSEYWNDKKLAEMCGLEVKDICNHEEDKGWLPMDILIFKCIKCGEFY